MHRKPTISEPDFTGKAEGKMWEFTGAALYYLTADHIPYHISSFIFILLSQIQKSKPDKHRPVIYKKLELTN